MANPFSQTESFRIWLEKAIRSDDDADWTAHTVDYAAFKIMLKGMAKRRVKLRRLIREAPNGRLSHAVLQQTLSEPLTSASKIDMTDTNNHGMSSKDMNVIFTATQSSLVLPLSSSTVALPSSTAAALSSSDVFPQGDFSPALTREGALVGSDFDRINEQLTPAPDGQYQSMDHIEISASSDAESSQPSSRGGTDTLFFNKNRSKLSTMRKVSSHERSEMINFLHWEMDKVQMFYHAQWQNLTTMLEELTTVQPNQQTSASWMENATKKQVKESNKQTKLLGDEILELFAFCVINIVTVCQILIRYDAYARTFEGTPMLDYFTKQVVKHPTSFRKILYHEELIALADSYQNLVVDSAKANIEPSQKNLNSIDLEDTTSSAFEAQREMFVSIINATNSPQTLAANENTDLADTFIKTLRVWIEFGTYEDQLGLEPAYLTMRGKSLTSEMKTLAEWRKRRKNKHSGVLPTPEADTADLTASQVFSLTLNLISAFLYCMNYYIVEPSSTLYVNRLRAHDAMSGTLIGMMPLAAFLSSIPYSMWTNYSFRHPLIMSCTLLLVGNLIYSLADQVRAVEIALLGRFICGLGAPKCIIRRFLADTTPVTLRTSVNASFGMVVAAGSAMGPAMAVILNRLDTFAILPVVGLTYFNGLTMPGYFMAALWGTFLLIVLLTFEEPNRDGLEEQKRLEHKKVGHENLESTLFSTNDQETRPVVPQPSEDLDASSTAMGDQHFELQTIFSVDTFQSSMYSPSQSFHGTSGSELPPDVLSNQVQYFPKKVPALFQKTRRWCSQFMDFLELITLPVRICLGLLFAKVFTIEALVSATSALSKNRYHWQVEQVGTLGFVNGCLVIPFSILIGRMSRVFQDQKLMRYLVAIGCCGFFLLIDLSDLVATPTGTYNQDHPLAVGPKRYISGYFVCYLSIQAFEGVIGSTLSKVIPTALASGTFNSGLLATLVDTLGRACGDMFISSMGFISLRQLMNLLFVPGFMIMLTCLVIIERYRDLLAV
ncbi:hypothetical protein ACA910_001384 [Epithemia clementina (nom. ined.)]